MHYMEGLSMSRWLFGVDGGILYSGYGEYRTNAPAQPVHAGWDIGPGSGAAIRALGRCEVVRVRDFDSVSGYHQEVTVWYRKALAYALYGHVRSGIPVGVGDVLSRRDLISFIGSRYDSMGTDPHVHVQCWKDRASMLSYDNTAAIDPARLVRFYGELK